MDKHRSYASVAALVILLAMAWLFWSGIYKPILLWLGAFSCALSVYVAYRVGFFESRSGFHLLPKLVRYWVWVLKEVYTSSLAVTKIVLSPSLPTSPTLVALKAKPKGPLGQVILSNAITLSPGTVSLDLHNGTLLVHCLTEASADSVDEANRKTAALTDE